MGVEPTTFGVTSPMSQPLIPELGTIQNVNKSSRVYLISLILPSCSKLLLEIVYY